MQMRLRIITIKKWDWVGILESARGYAFPQCGALAPKKQR